MPNLDFAAYERAFFTMPPPPPRFRFQRISGVAIEVEDLERAQAFYAQVLGPPAYVESDARGWRIGQTWLTLLPGERRAASVSFSIEVETPQEADRLQRAFADAGATIRPASDQLMYRPIRMCPVVDPFGTDILVISPLPTAPA
jgi:hypothetical protein